MQGRIGPDGASRYAADVHDLASFENAQLALSALRTPVLHTSVDPRSRLYVAAFDGTGNDRDNASLGPWTNVALLERQIRGRAAEHPHIRSDYVAGPGTQHGAFDRARDAATGGTYDARLEEMYLKFCRQAADWIRTDPDVRINVAEIGFSRGAEQAAGFARMVHERGIRDPAGVQVHRDRNGLIDRIDYRADLPALRPPGSVAQAELLFDPVGTGEPSRHDRRPPPSVLSGLQIYAEDERRDLFRASQVIDPGQSADGRFLGVVVGGAHSNIGGGYHEDGLSRRSFNLGVDFLNSLSDRPFLEKTWLRPDLDVVVRSEEHAAIYDDDRYRANERAGLPEDRRRPRIECIDGRASRCGPAGRDAEPVDAALDAEFPRRLVPIGPVPGTPPEFRDRPPASERDDLQREPPAPGFMRWLLKPLADARDAASDPLIAQAEVAVRALDRGLGREFDGSSARMTASLAALAKTEGFGRIDAVVLSDAVPTARPGENVFIVQGGLHDATNRVAHLKTDIAVATPIEDSLARIAQANIGATHRAPVAAQEQDRPVAPRLTV